MPCEAQMAISLARTALTDPAALPAGEGPDKTQLREYAIAKLDEALALLVAE